MQDHLCPCLDAVEDPGFRGVAVTRFDRLQMRTAGGVVDYEDAPLGILAAAAAEQRAGGVQMKLRPSAVDVHSSVAMDVKVSGLSQEDAEKIVAAGHAICPYSKAIQGNVDVTIHVSVA